ncbi:MAG: hypothetical protein KC766_06940 [Myxococcales bacterium]|nr:hypothetical protein [Myxococcales bacterium]
MLFDEPKRTIQLAIIHPDAVPSGAAAIVPGLPAKLPRQAIDALLDLRLTTGG